MNFTCSNQEACPVILDSKCVIYEGENLLYIGVNTNDNYRTALQNINTAIGNLVLSGGITQLIGDVVAVGPGIASATLATVNSTPGQYGSSTAIPKVTVDGKGRVTAITTEAVFIPSGALSFIGDVTGTGNTGSNTTLTLATVNSNIYTTNTFLKFAANAKGLVTSATPVVSGDITGALGYTPYNSTNPSGFISGITSLMVTTALGYTPYNSTNPAGYISGITGTMVTDALGYTPYNSTNPNGYINTISGIVAGGELAGTYPNPTLVNAAVTAKVLTGVNVTGGSISATDSILTAFGKVQNQINGLIGGSIYQGVWNAATNTPTLTSSVGTKGYYYIVNVPGSTNLNGITDWELGDWAIFDGTAWQQVDNTDAVVSVNGFTGAVSLTTDNISEGLTNQYFTTSRARLALSGGTGISYDNVTGVITNSSPDQIVGISSGAGINVTGTYPNFTIASTITQYTDALARQAISLTTTGTSGAATYDNITGILNIPIYTTDLSGYVPITRTLTINGTTYDLSADRSWTISGSAPAGGLSGQILAKNSDADYDYTWIDNFADWTATVKEYIRAAEPINKGQAVYVSGANGTNIIVSKASNASEATSSKTLGLLAQTLATNGNGYVITEGLLSGLNTIGANIGDPVWLGTNGDLIYGLINKPYAPAHLVYIGVVVRVNANNGEIFIQPQNGFEMDELHNVSARNPNNNAILAYNTTTSLWEKNTIAGVLGYTPADDSLVVPYIGATADVDLGAFTISAGATSSNIVYANGSGSSSGMLYLKQGTIAANYTGYNGIYATSTSYGFIADTGSTYKLGIFSLASLTDATARTYTLPNASGTLALTSDLSSYVPTTRTLTINGTTYDLSADRSWTIAGGVTSFNTRTGAITLVTGDVTSALGFTPYNATNPDGYITSASLSGYLPLTGGTLTGALSGTSATFSGRVGIGGSVSSWTSGWNVAQVNTASLNNVGSFSQLSNNIFYDGTNYKYINTAGAGRIGFNTDGELFIGTAASGSAGSVATMTTRLSINGSTGAATFSNSVGIGVAPFSGVGPKTLDLEGGTELFGFYNSTYLLSNAQYTFGGFLYKEAGRASYINLNSSNNGSIVFATADTGTAGGAAFFTTQMRIKLDGTVEPGANGTQNLGSSSLRWATVYTSDLDMSNGVGDYTIVEGREDLFLYNNITKKVFKFALIEIDPSEATPKLKR